jgi:hypothetical protein
MISLPGRVSIGAGYVKKLYYIGQYTTVNEAGVNASGIVVTNCRY